MIEISLEFVSGRKYEETRYVDVKFGAGVGEFYTSISVFLTLETISIVGETDYDSTSEHSTEKGK
jgi:hypothetical protein